MCGLPHLRLRLAPTATPRSIAVVLPKQVQIHLRSSRAGIRAHFLTADEISQERELLPACAGARGGGTPWRHLRKRKPTVARISAAEASFETRSTDNGTVIPGEKDDDGMSVRDFVSGLRTAEGSAGLAGEGSAAAPAAAGAGAGAGGGGARSFA